MTKHVEIWFLNRVSPALGLRSRRFSQHGRLGAKMNDKTPEQDSEGTLKAKSLIVGQTGNVSGQNTRICGSNPAVRPAENSRSAW
jgi:hypothetical protein